MKKSEGFTIVEIITILAISLVVVILIFLMFFFAGREARDVKRTSDISVLRSVMASTKIQFGSYAESGCQSGPVYACQNSRLEKLLPTIYNFRDPKSKVLCSDDCTQPCEYSFSQISDDDFEVLFYLETGIGNYSKKGCYRLNASGVELIQ
ncbi:hypothetical protein A2533_03320 [Candidatus Falkowbacteria bacterium RIFOXYD2_FULL_35_9]|uniref:Type II secretion system protein GspG C-terminal domain-containing protein n=1 Tax=Candidatus Falkowbacteria bacterium RIFOXYC2_FULL_36_12 TaxID=1798002 RepID=A0A1F5SZ53_9BACT|nr:MAG: hypothetical protein A2300_02135 [Candidatus Falkowbacteria bacterium RIFOXYB2_FULL_35_7]OGF31733.1 MAG: hypothetical protein A2478_04580 [Candidatus Falkowbacteria bacterium RIFOXYC2_FULL_36_12]OGF34068.1 MAG: hypothetical protein A2223_04340 [Candidatus Falkowbacteria bacterium RIFOXYA2_FULL_35_8]OGF47737.1 MAG: hypothetical protein A2533_03320 [Candidatus Falkowbacteria bacterium RIFOXYD2_FULL_35_9]